MLIRQEQAEDYEKVYHLITAAFETAEHADGSEQDLAAALRQSDAFIPSLSLVAEIDGELAGHILFTKARVGNSEVLALAPLSVLPKYQRQGVGTALIAEGHRIAQKLGYPYSLVLGSETYYPRARVSAGGAPGRRSSRRISAPEFYGHTAAGGRGAALRSRCLRGGIRLVLTALLPPPGCIGAYRHFSSPISQTAQWPGSALQSRPYPGT